MKKITKKIRVVPTLIVAAVRSCCSMIVIIIIVVVIMMSYFWTPGRLDRCLEMAKMAPSHAVLSMGM